MMPAPKKFFCFILLIIISGKINASVSDSLHAAHYDIYIDSIDYSSTTLKASCSVTLVAKQNVSEIPLSLLRFTVDSVLYGGLHLSYTYNDTTLLITPAQPLQAGDTTGVHIYYHGQPEQDPGGWGGFYFSGTYAFNLGVGLYTDPHNFGRAWFPCIDEFTDRSLYDFHVTTASGYKAFCNGILMSETANPNGTVTWHWKMNQTIPTYLASIAVSTYYTLKRTSNGLDVEWACAVADTQDVLNTFQHLDTVLSSYITAYGPYPFDKVGYALVPFNGGAMEHATSIHIGRVFINGLGYETLWAHELSHMWWGDKVTCSSEGDMWLNESFASFNEAFMTEKVYGLKAYKDWIRSNHRRVLQFAHIEDGSYLAMTNVPHSHTYGSTVYNKGVGVIHTLRNYMGDSAFFAGCRHYLNNRAFNHASTTDLRDDMQASSGISMSRFFDDWVFEPGFPHFSIDSVIYMPGGLDHYFVYVRQRSKGNNHVYSMPVEINFTNGIIDTSVTVTIDSVNQMFHIPLFMIAEMVTLDREEKICDAITSYEKWITATGTQLFPETNVSLNITATGVDSSLVRIEHNWVQPDGWKQSNPGIRISDYHYWKVDGLFRQGFASQATFTYNGSNNPNTGYIDNTLITTSEDSLVLLYRPGVEGDWQPLNATLIPGNPTDKIGTIRIDTLYKGEYALGIYDHSVSVTEKNIDTYNFSVHPNPSADTFYFTYEIPSGKKGLLQICNATGQVLYCKKVNAKEDRLAWNSRHVSPGIYLATLLVDGKASTVRIVVRR